MASHVQIVSADQVQMATQQQQEHPEEVVSAFFKSYSTEKRTAGL